ncbi:MAG: hypothetical protein HKN14_08250 [Marinicaulis sp.]|nr:hypothetical protein [Marinicaulis sp.]NNE40896.1 hypothetical protein [Marinicaulis sp.]NNL89066.1 hypothetical protein [Marinicaulis sp.]
MQQKHASTDNLVEAAARDPASTAVYIEELVREFERLARKDEIWPLEKILRLARQEARCVATS